MPDWPVERLGDLVDASRGISYGIVQPGEHQPGGVPIIRVSDLKGDSVETGKPLRVAPSIEAAHSRTRLRGGELIMSIVGTVGQTAIVDPSLEGWNVARAVAVIPVKRDIGPYWIRLALKGGPARAHIQDRLNTTVQATLNLRDLASLPIVVPPAPEREAIAATLGALDDKIELNRKMNATLEAMARALFRDWFVDFGPTRAKMAQSALGAKTTTKAEAPYLSPTLWPLFPDRLDAEGKPEGWEEKPLDEIADFLNGLALQKFPGEGEADSLPVIKIAELRNGISGKSNRASRKVPPQYVIQDGDFLFSWSGSLLAKFWTGGEGALNQHLFKVTSDRYPTWFFSEWVQHHLEEFQIIAASKATTMGHIQRGHLKAAMTICPPDHVIEHMGLIVGPMVDQIIHNDLESRTLAQTRDLLLPRLMSGELRLAGAETLTSEVA